MFVVGFFVGDVVGSEVDRVGCGVGSVVGSAVGIFAVGPVVGLAVKGMAITVKLSPISPSLSPLYSVSSYPN